MCSSRSARRSFDPEPVLKPFFVYLLRCADGSYYTGHTDDLELRLAQHASGVIRGYTHDRRPVELVWSQETATREEALSAESQIKGWSRAKKKALTVGDWARVSALARSGELRPAGLDEVGLRRARLVRKVADRAGLRQAQPERAGEGFGQDLPERAGEGLGQARPEREVGDRAGLRQAQPERAGEGFGQAQPERAGEGFGQDLPERAGEGFRQARPEREVGDRAGLRQAQPERAGEGFGQAQPERAGEGFGQDLPERAGEGFGQARPEREVGDRAGLRQAQPERAGEGFGQDLPERAGEGFGQARPERGTGKAQQGTVKVCHPYSVRPEPVEGPASTPCLASPVPASPAWIEALASGDRRVLAKSITLLESTRPDHRAQADAMLDAILPRTGRAMRLGVSGVPGVGKSTFIEALGLMLTARGHRIAVLAIDPSSSVSGGSILGDKTRMERLSVHEAVYIRPSPASGTLGGVAEKTREAMLVCEAAGYDIVVVETIGVGQSETAVADMTDLFVLLQLPNAGDDLQALKKGVMELADLVVVNKADIDPDAAACAEAHIESSLRMLAGRVGPGQWVTRVMRLSASNGQGLDVFWAAVEEFHRQRRSNGEFEARRRRQALAWMWDIVDARLNAGFRRHPAVRSALPATLDDVAAARVAPSSAARTLLDLFAREF